MNSVASLNRPESIYHAETQPYPAQKGASGLQAQTGKLLRKEGLRLGQVDGGAVYTRSTPLPS